MNQQHKIYFNKYNFLLMTYISKEENCMEMNGKSDGTGTGEKKRIKKEKRNYPME